MATGRRGDGDGAPWGRRRRELMCGWLMLGLGECPRVEDGDIRFVLLTCLRRTGRSRGSPPFRTVLVSGLRMAFCSASQN
ncbi:hypothetical protein U1Q18_020916 [Sarracenia purpurea var. burkii]